DKGRKGMASTFLVRLRLGPRLVDAKGVSRLYRASVKPSQLLVLVGAALAVITVVISISPPVRSFLALLLLGVRAAVGL
ncbi:MAG: SteA C-terminal domain-containing protein, partial [Actinomycetota bacterium]|nr:SteA C-terminal domain-containing protein [Actinomycetota bacterium]